MVKRVDALTEAQKSQMDAWADKWIEIGLRVGTADRPKFEAAAQRCYEAAGIPWRGNVVWVSSPLVMAIAAPVAALVIELNKRKSVSVAVGDAVDGAVRGAVGDAVDGAVRDAVRGAVGVAVRGAVDGAVGDAVDGAVDGAVRGAVGGAVRGAVGDAVRGAVDGAVGDAVDGAVRGAVGDAVRGAVRGAVGVAVSGAVDGAVRGAVDGAVDGAVGGAVRDAVDGAVRGAVRGNKQIRQAIADVIRNIWHRYMGGQFWCGGWYWGGSYASFFREVCDLELKGDLWDRGRAYEETIQSACWWYPHRDFVMVCERPKFIERELVDPNRARGWGSHRLHRDDGPAVQWADGFGVYSVHGVQIPFSKRYIIDHPGEITPEKIGAETNAEIRRVMIERYGVARYMVDAGAILVDSRPDDFSLKGLRGAKLWRKDVPDDEPIIMIECTNSTPEPDGHSKIYHLRVDPNAYGGKASKDCLAAMASTWRMPNGDLVFARPTDYAPTIET